MKEKKTSLAILEGKCPHCREGQIFKYSAFKLNKFGSMHKQCPACGHEFEQEPGFFYGAMYVSYGLSVGIFLSTVFVLYFLLGDPSLTIYLVTVTIMAIILYPLTFRYSRILYIYLFSST